MLVIAEKINVMSKTIGPAMKNRDKGPIQQMARAQVDAGANLLDINLGPATKEGPEMMQWVVNTVQEVTDCRLCLDTKNAEAMEAGLKVCKTQPMINSTSAERALLERFMPMAATFEAEIIALTMTERGISRDTDERIAAAADIMGAAMEFNVPLDRIYLDPLLLPVGIAQSQATEALESLRMFKQLSDPAMKSVVGLSNIYNGCPPQVHSMLAATYLVMLVDAGLDAAIMDPLDPQIMGTVKTMDILSNNTLYCSSFLD